MDNNLERDPEEERDGKILLLSGDGEIPVIQCQLTEVHAPHNWASGRGQATCGGLTNTDINRVWQHEEVTMQEAAMDDVPVDTRRKQAPVDETPILVARYFTFGVGHKLVSVLNGQASLREDVSLQQGIPLGKKYVKIVGYSDQNCRNIMSQYFGQSWSFMYDEQDIKQLAPKYGWTQLIELRDVEDY
jgi:hypothetical protein